ncbi:MAG: radical SAM protein [Acidimicrobiia bacterium]|nr:radical SAM protein [Acidimicrobiia bacterium]
MTDTFFLSPGFLLTMAGNRQIKFPHLRANLRPANSARLAVIDALSRGHHGSIDALVDEIANRHDAPADAVRRFVNGVRDVGYITATPPPVRFPVVDSGATPDAAPTGEVVIDAPVSLIVEAGEYLWYDHEGELRARLSLPEVRAAAMFCVPTTVDAARTRYVGRGDLDGLDEANFDQLIGRLAGAGLLDTPPVLDDLDDTPPPATDGRAIVQDAVDAAVLAHDEAMAGVEGDRIPVVPVNTDHAVAPTSLGLLVAFAMEHDDQSLRDRYDFVPMFLADETRLIERAATPGVYLFSNYVWNVDENLRLSAAIKAANPANITVHGGPSTPKYDVDAELFFATHPHVDIAVRGEGELTFAYLLDALDPSSLGNLGVLADVAGLTYRTADGVQRTADRERIADLDTIPSPYIMGLLDPFGAAHSGAIIETNRGCPYGCTFCDWGSATLSRIRKFSLDRVYAELQWCADQQIDVAAIADANFGIMERDVSIAGQIADLKRAHGFPRTVATNYAKNTVKHLRQIIEILADVEILTEGVVSLQSMDEPTLKIIKRSNIKLEKYNELSTEFRRAKLPLAADIMMGLPGSTPAAFRSDLQKCTDRDVRIRANPTQLLPNSPMNEPSYRAEHGIVAQPGELVKETATYTRAEWEDMDELRVAYYVFDNWGVLRYVARHVRRELGMMEVDFYDAVRREVLANPDDWPVIATTLRILEGYMAPPGSWGLFIDEVRRYLIEHLDMADDSALRTTLAVQHAHLPAPGRTFPQVLELDHDFAAWQDQLLTTREDGHRDSWHELIPSLHEFGPATLTVHDPNDICRIDVGKPMGALAFALRSWEMESPVARPRLGATTGA